eukprot:GHVL01034272.1.p2 GENE.GHVL01034272.1~~GHVL01034272.1.p2  ORF type:complete len:181 (+),score=32.25 GHVL01034272.1:1096-1638(+)
MVNPSEQQVEVKFTAVNECKDPAPTLAVLTEPFNTRIAPFNDLSDLHEVYAEEAPPFSIEDDLSLIPERKFNRIMVALRVNPLKGCCGKVATCVIQCNLKVKDKAEKDHELTVDMVLSLGGIVNFPGEQLVTETNDQNLCTSYAVSHTTDHGPVPSSVPQASNNTEAPTEKTDSDNVAID